MKTTFVLPPPHPHLYAFVQKIGKEAASESVPHTSVRSSSPFEHVPFFPAKKTTKMKGDLNWRWPQTRATQGVIFLLISKLKYNGPSLQTLPSVCRWLSMSEILPNVFPVYSVEMFKHWLFMTFLWLHESNPNHFSEFTKETINCFGENKWKSTQGSDSLWCSTILQ